MDVTSWTDELRERLHSSPGVREVVYDPNRHDQVESLLLERQLLGVCLNSDDIIGEVPSGDMDRVTEIDGDDSRAEPMGLIAVSAGSCANVQHETAPEELRLEWAKVVTKVSLPLRTQLAEMLPLVREAVGGSATQIGESVRLLCHFLAEHDRGSGDDRIPATTFDAANGVGSNELKRTAALQAPKHLQRTLDRWFCIDGLYVVSRASPILVGPDTIITVWLGSDTSLMSCR
jgi:hypothetical protein